MLHICCIFLLHIFMLHIISKNDCDYAGDAAGTSEFAMSESQKVLLF